MTKKTEIKCPLCGRFTFYSAENAFRPFCSERCKLIDLGQWADGRYAVPAEKADFENLTPDQILDLENSDLHSDSEE